MASWFRNEKSKRRLSEWANLLVLPFLPEALVSLSLLALVFPLPRCDDLAAFWLALCPPKREAMRKSLIL